MSQLKSQPAIKSSIPNLQLGKKGKVLHPQTRECIARVIEFMRKEAETVRQGGTPLIPLVNYKQRVLAATGISKKTYSAIMNEASSITKGEATAFGPLKNKKPKLHVKVEQENSIFLKEVVSDLFETEEIVQIGVADDEQSGDMPKLGVCQNIDI